MTLIILIKQHSSLSLELLSSMSIHNLMSVNVKDLSFLVVIKDFTAVN